MDAEVFRVHADVERRHWWFSARRAILRAVVETVAPPGRGVRVLDVGCGVGATAPAFHPDYTYTGYEPSQLAVEHARAAHPHVEFRAGTAVSAAADLAAADVVLLTDVIEHVADDRALLLATLLPMRAGSWLLVTVPAGMELWSPHDVSLGHYRRYDVESLSAVLHELPAETVLLSYFNARLYPPIRLVRWLTERTNRAAGHGGTDFAVPPRPLNAALRRVFEGEAARLCRQIGRTGSAYRRGVSLMALLRKQPGNARAPS
jgi:SAM-dependent methyltransferase